MGVPMLRLDHVIIAVPDLDAAIEDYRVLGFTVNYGGKHASGATHNALICFSDGTYIELLALVEGAQPSSATSLTGQMLQKGEGLVGYALLSQDFQTDIETLRARGVNVSAVSDGGRTRSDGVELRWRGVLVDGGTSPFLIEDVTARN